MKRKEYKAHSYTLCYDCTKCTDLRLCGWTGHPGTLPRGAEYTERTLTECGRTRKSYAITHCPYFEKGRAKKVSISN